MKRSTSFLTLSKSCVQIWSSSSDISFEDKSFCYLWNYRRRLFPFFPNATNFFKNLPLVLYYSCNQFLYPSVCPFHQWPASIDSSIFRSTSPAEVDRTVLKLLESIVFKNISLFHLCNLIILTFQVLFSFTFSARSEWITLFSQKLIHFRFQ